MITENEPKWPRNGIPEGYVSLRKVARDNNISIHRITRELNALPKEQTINSLRLGRIIAIPMSQIEKIIEICKDKN